MTGQPSETAEVERSRSRGPSLTEMLVGLTLLAIGLIWLLDTSDVVSISWYAVLAIVLMVVGVALVVGSMSGEHGGLIALGVILTVVLTGATWADLRFEGGLGDRDFAPASVDELRESYRLSAGTLTLDLRGVELPTGETLVEGRVGAGELIVIVPDDLAVSVDWRVAAGDVSVFNREQSGIFLDDRETTADYDGAERQLRLDLIVTAGTIEVRR